MRSIYLPFRRPFPVSPLRLIERLTCWQGAEAELHRFDSEFGDLLADYGPILLRSEAASSSQIENLTASARQIFTAELGGKGARNAEEIAANTNAMVSALELSSDLSAESIREMHRVLMGASSTHS